jgi:hypothetical protein
VIRWIDVHPALVGLPMAFAYMSWAAVGLFGGRALTVLKTCVAYLLAMASYATVMVAATMVYVIFFMSAEYSKLDDWSLVSATDQGQVDVVRTLLAEGADPAQPVRRTALQAAAGSGQLEVVDLLLEHGADPSVTNQEGETAADVARSGDLEDRLRPTSS